MMEITHLRPLGASVSGVRVDALAPDEVDELQALLARHGVLILGGRDVGDDSFMRFLRSFGEPVFTAGETPVPGFPDLNVISNIGRTTPPRSTFHIDTSYVRHPPSYTALRAVSVPNRGGHTLFTNQYAAYESLSAELRADLEGRSVTHIVTGVEIGPHEETSAVHPIFCVHPISGRTALYLTSAARCAEISGMSPRETSDTIATLLAHSTREANVYRHSWSPGDVVMWDNRCVMHCADHDGVDGDRVMHRGMVVSRPMSQT